MSNEKISKPNVFLQRGVSWVILIDTYALVFIIRLWHFCDIKNCFISVWCNSIFLIIFVKFILITFFQIDRNSSMIHHSERNEYFSLNDEHFSNAEDQWVAIKKSEVPQRHYFNEFLVSFLLPVIILFILVILLSFLLCFHHDAM